MLQVNRVFNGLSMLQKDLLVGIKGCGYVCRTVQLGAITRLLNSTMLLNHSSEKDNHALSVGKLLIEVGAAACPSWCGPYHHSPHECPTPGNAFRLTMKSIANEVDKASVGLTISEFAKGVTWSK